MIKGSTGIGLETDILMVTKKILDEAEKNPDRPCLENAEEYFWGYTG